MEEAVEIYLPLSRLIKPSMWPLDKIETQYFINFWIRKRQHHHSLLVSRVVYSRKSTTARLLKALLSRWENHPKVELVTTDGFLYPNEILEEKGLMSKKGFPESYDIKALVNFVSDVKACKARDSTCVFSPHLQHY